MTTAERSNDGVAARGMTVDLPGVHLWVTDTGGTATPVVLLHANTGTSANWIEQNTAFAAAGYRVIAFDRRGWGNSTPDPATGPQPGSTTEDLHALVEHLGLERFHLVGVAGGGFVAVDYAAWQPARLRSVVAAATMLAVTDEPSREMFARLMTPEFRAMSAEFREVSPGYRAENPEGTARWVEIEQAAQRPGSPAQPLRTPNTYAKLDSITVPTLALMADADLIAPPALMRLWVAHVKHAEVAVVPEAGHSVAWEHPDTFNRMVLDFIKRH